MQLNICEGEGGRAGLRPAWRPHHSVATSLPARTQLSSSTGEFFCMCIFKPYLEGGGEL